MPNQHGRSIINLSCTYLHSSIAGFFLLCVPLYTPLVLSCEIVDFSLLMESYE